MERSYQVARLLDGWKPTTPDETRQAMADAFEILSQEGYRGWLLQADGTINEKNLTELSDPASLQMFRASKDEPLSPDEDMPVPTERQEEEDPEKLLGQILFISDEDDHFRGAILSNQQDVNCQIFLDLFKNAIPLARAQGINDRPKILEFAYVYAKIVYHAKLFAPTDPPSEAERKALAFATSPDRYNADGSFNSEALSEITPGFKNR